MATFHPFPRLPLEIRILIWELAVEQSRVLKIRQLTRQSFLEPFSPAYWSPTNIPSVTRVCRESRKHSRYQKAFITEASPRFLWVNFENDVLQIQSNLMNNLGARDCMEREEIRHVRVELPRYPDGQEDTENFYYHHSDMFRLFPGMTFANIIWVKGTTNFCAKLASVDILVDVFMHIWTSLIEETYFGSCPKKNVRVIKNKTGEWIDVVTSGPYQDYLDTNGGETRWYCREVDYYGDPDGPEDDEERYQEMMKLAKGLPRIQLE